MSIADTLKTMGPAIAGMAAGGMVPAPILNLMRVANTGGHLTSSMDPQMQQFVQGAMTGGFKFGGPGSPYGAMTTRSNVPPGYTPNSVRGILKEEASGYKTKFKNFNQAYNPIYQMMSGKTADAGQRRKDLESQKAWAREANRYGMTPRGFQLLSVNVNTLLNNSIDLQATLLKGLFAIQQINTRYVVSMATQLGVTKQNVLKEVPNFEKTFIGQMLGAIRDNIMKIPGVSAGVNITSSLMRLLNPLTLGKRIAGGANSINEGILNLLLGKNQRAYEKDPEKVKKDAGTYQSLQDRTLKATIGSSKILTQLWEVNVRQLEALMNIEDSTRMVAQQYGGGKRKKYMANVLRKGMEIDETTGELVSKVEAKRIKENLQSAERVTYMNATKQGMLGGITGAFFEVKSMVKQITSGMSGKANELDKIAMRHAFYSGAFFLPNDPLFLRFINMYGASPDLDNQKVADDLKAIINSSEVYQKKFDKLLEVAKKEYEYTNVTEFKKKIVDPISRSLTGNVGAFDQNSIVRFADIMQKTNNRDLAHAKYSGGRQELFAAEKNEDFFNALLNIVMPFRQFRMQKQINQFGLESGSLVSAAEQGLNGEEGYKYGSNVADKVLASAKGGKFSFIENMKDAIVSALTDELKDFKTDSIAGFLKSMAHGPHGAFAAGGLVKRAGKYRVGEAGPEMIDSNGLSETSGERERRLSARAQQKREDRFQFDMISLLEEISLKISPHDPKKNKPEKEEGIFEKIFKSIGGFGAMAMGGIGSMVSGGLKTMFSSLGAVGASVVGFLGKSTGLLMNPAAWIIGLGLAGTAWAMGDAIDAFKTGGTSGFLKQLFGGGSEGGLTSMFKAMGPWALTGATLGSVVPGLGTIAGGLIGGAIGGLVGYFSTDDLSSAWEYMTTTDKIVNEKFGWKEGSIASTFSSYGRYLPFAGPFVLGGIGYVADQVGDLFIAAADGFSAIWDKLKNSDQIITEKFGWSSDSTAAKLASYGKVIPFIGPTYLGLMGSMIDITTDALSNAFNSATTYIKDKLYSFLPDFIKNKISSSSSSSLSKETQNALNSVQSVHGMQGYASGGIVDRLDKYRVGEAGPEIVTGPQVKTLMPGQMVIPLERGKRKAFMKKYGDAFSGDDGSGVDFDGMMQSSLQSLFMENQSASEASGGSTAGLSGFSGETPDQTNKTLKERFEAVKNAIETASDKVLGKSQENRADMARLMAIESGFNPYDQSSKSSAKGLAQFINSTWKMMTNKFGSKFGLTGSPDEIFDPLKHAYMTAEYMQMNRNVAQGALGTEPSGVDTYILHNLGPGMGRKFLSSMKTNGNVPVSSVLPQNFIDNNPIFFYSDPSKKSGLLSVDNAYKMYSKYYGGRVGKDIIDELAGGDDIFQSILQNSLNGAFSSGGTSGSGQSSLPSSVAPSINMQDMQRMNVSGQLAWPAKDSLITSPMGPRFVNNPGYPGVASTNHKGIDIKANTGDPIFSIMGGQVIDTDPKWGGVTIAHPGGWSSRYLHMSGIGVKPGDSVTPGSPIGRAGGMGEQGPNSYPAHLHLETKFNGETIDPEALYYSYAKNGGKTPYNPASPNYGFPNAAQRSLRAKLAGNYELPQSPDPKASGGDDFIYGKSSSIRRNLSSYQNENPLVSLLTDLKDSIANLASSGGKSNIIQPVEINQVNSAPANTGNNTDQGNASMQFGDKNLDMLIDKLFNSLSVVLPNAMKAHTGIYI